MRKIDISEYGKRYSAFRTITAGESTSHCLHIPKKPSFKHSFIKMLWLIWKNPFATKKQILEFARLPLNALLLSYGSSGGVPMNPDIHDYWAELHRYGYVEQWGDGKIVKYKLTELGEDALMQIPLEEMTSLGIY